MPLSAYPFIFIQRDKENTKGLLYVSLYRFKSTKSKLVYIVRVEEYEYHVYAIKFYQKSHSNSPHKYRLLTNTNEPRRIINTCIKIMLSLYNKDTYASFGFIGANGLDESERCTKRYRVYSRIIATYISSTIFTHKENKDKSAYMLINNSFLKEHPHLIEDIEIFFASQYEYFE